MNNTETAVAEALRTEGWTVLRRGWPDFLCHRDGMAAAIEVKSPRDRLSEDQVQIHRVLVRCGLPVQTVWVSDYRGPIIVNGMRLLTAREAMWREYERMTGKGRYANDPPLDGERQ